MDCSFSKDNSLVTATVCGNNFSIFYSNANTVAVMRQHHSKKNKSSLKKIS